MCAKIVKYTSEPTRLPTVSLALPTVWFHAPSCLAGSSLVTAPEEEAEMPGALRVAWERSSSTAALSFFASPAFYIVYQYMT